MLALSSHPKNNNNRYEGTTHLSFKTTCLFPWLAFARMFATIFSVLSSADSINNLSVLLLLKKENICIRNIGDRDVFNSPLRLASLNVALPISIMTKYLLKCMMCIILSSFQRRDSSGDIIWTNVSGRTNSG